MYLTVRDPVAADFPHCYRICYGSFGYPNEPGDNVAGELCFLWNQPVTLARVLEDQEQPAERRVVGYVSAVFVTNSFVRWACADMPPYVNPALQVGPPGGVEALLSPAAIAAAQSGDGLNLLITHWGWDAGLPADAGLRVRDRLGKEFFGMVGGYKIKEILIEVVGADLCRLAMTVGYHVRRAYGGPPEEPPASLPDQRPFLMGVSRAEALAREGTWISRAFVHHPPRFFFTPVQRDLLPGVLRGGSDKDYAEAHGLDIKTPKKRWDKIFATVETQMPNLLPCPMGDTRGPEKRRRLLQYLRDHPAELRPHAKRPVKRAEE